MLAGVEKRFLASDRVGIFAAIYLSYSYVQLTFADLLAGRLSAQSPLSYFFLGLSWKCRIIYTGRKTEGSPIRSNHTSDYRMAVSSTIYQQKPLA